MSVEVWVSGQGEKWVTTSLNPSRIEDPDGWGLVPTHRVPDLLAGVWPCITDLVEIASPLDLALLSRVDVARDLQCSSPLPRVMGALARAPKAGYGQSKVVWEASKEYGETLYWGNRSGIVRLYDKHAQSNGAAPPGIVRFEVQARRSWTRRYFPTVGDLNDTSADRIARDMWSRSGFGIPFRPLPGWLAGVTNDQKLSGAVIRSFVGEVFLQENGVLMPISPTTRAKHKRLLERHGIPQGADESDSSHGELKRLDPAEGHEVGFSRSHNRNEATNLQQLEPGEDRKRTLENAQW